MFKLLTWDKFMHFAYMYAIQITLLLMFGPWTLFATLVFPLAKETYDVKKLKSKFDPADFLISIVGGITSYLVYML